ncbi:MAG: RidA family protein [Phycisphaerae bacterium]
MKPSERLSALGLELPSVPTPVGSYVPATRCGHYIITSGQLPMRDGAVVCTGKLGANVSLDEATAAAGLAAMSALAAAAGVAGGVDRIGRVIRLCVFVNSTADFADQAKVANGASDLLTGIFDDAGRHVRSAVGVAALPLNSAVELELMVEVVDVP